MRSRFALVAAAATLVALCIRVPVADAFPQPRSAEGEIWVWETLPTAVTVDGGEDVHERWLGSMDSVQVVVKGATPVFSRHTPRAEGPSLKLRVPVPPTRPGVWTIRQPPGAPAVWSVRVPRGTAVEFRRADRRRPRLIAEYQAREVLAWVQGRRSTMPEYLSDAMQRRLQADLELAQALLAEDSNTTTRQVVQGWRTLAALQELDLHRPLVGPFFRRTELEGRAPGAGLEAEILGQPDDPVVTGSHARPYRVVEDGLDWPLELEGPGVLEVQWRAVVLDSHDGAAIDYSATVDDRLPHSERLTSRVSFGPSGSSNPVAAPIPRRDEYGQQIGPLISRRVWVPPGSHRVHVALAGASLLLRATWAERVPDTATEATQTDWRRGPTKALAKHRERPSVGSERVAPLLATLAGRATLPADGDTDLAGLAPTDAAALLLLRARLGHRDDAAPRFRRAQELLRSHLGSARDASVWQLRADLLDLARSIGLVDQVVTLLRPVAHTMPPDITAALAEHANGPDARAASSALALLEDARRRAPHDRAIAAAFRDEWNLRTRWTRLRPADPEAPLGWRWLEHRSARQADDERGLHGMPLGRGVDVEAPPSPGQPGRRARWRLFIQPKPEATLIRVHLDGQTLRVPVLDPLERVEFAVAPGRHHVRIDGAAQALSTLRPLVDRIAAEATQGQTVRMWPHAHTGAPIRFALEHSHRPGFVRLDLRALDNDPAPNRILVHDGVHPPQEVLLGAAEPDTEAFVIDAPAPAYPRRSVILPLDPLAKELWVEAERPVAVAWFVRRWANPTADGAALPHGSNKRSGSSAVAADPLHRVASLSRQLAKEDDFDTRLERAHALVDLAQIDLARDDFERAIELGLRGDRQRRDALESLLARIDGWNTSTHVAVHRDDVHVLAPPSATWTAARGRQRSVEAEARAHLQAGRFHEAARLWAGQWRNRGNVAAGLAAARAWLRHFDHPEATHTHAEVAYGHARRLLEVVDDPAVRRLVIVTGAMSKWDTLSHPDTSAGYERVHVPTRPTDPSPRRAVLDALRTPPWTDGDDAPLRAGQRVVWSARRTQTPQLEIRAYCQRLKPLGSETATLEFRDDREVQTFRVPHGQEVVLRNAPLTGGDLHRLSVALDAAARGWLCSVRAQDGTGRALAVDVRRKYHRLDPDAPLRAVLRGPATVMVVGRRVVRHDLDPDEPSDSAWDALPLTLHIQGSGHVEERAFLLPAGRDMTVAPDASRTLHFGPEGALIHTIPEGATHHLTLRSDRGSGVARIRVRRPGDGRAAPIERIPRGILVQAGALDDDFVRRGRPPLHAAPPRVSPPPREPWRVGTLSASAGYAREDNEDADRLRPRDRGFAFAHWRRGWGKRLWTRLDVGAGFQPDTATGADIRTRVDAPNIPGGVRMSGTASAFAQSFGGNFATTWAYGGMVDRPMNFAGRWQLVPRLFARAAHLGATSAEVDAGTEGVHPRFYNRYGADHPAHVGAELGMRVRTHTDARVFATLGTRTNADFQSLDRIDTELAWQGIALPRGPVLLPYRVGYSPSLRLADAHRSQTHVRHRLTLAPSLIWPYGWHGDIEISASYSLIYARPSGFAHLGLLTFAFHFSGGRARADHSPLRRPFRTFEHPRWWEER